MNSAREILDAHETAQRRAYACAVFFICAALLANSVSFGVAYFFSRVGDFSAISPYAISAYLDLALAAGFIFGFAPFASLRLKAIAAAGFFAYLEYSSTGIFGTGCFIAVASGRADRSAFGSAAFDSYFGCGHFCRQCCGVH